MEPLGFFFNLFLLLILICLFIFLVIIISSLLAQCILRSTIGILNCLNNFIPCCINNICLILNRIHNSLKNCVTRLFNINNRTVVVPEKKVEIEPVFCNSYIIIINPDNNIQIANTYGKTKIVPD
jgi:hypothetical protein